MFSLRSSLAFTVAACLAGAALAQERWASILCQSGPRGGWRMAELSFWKSKNFSR